MATRNYRQAKRSREETRKKKQQEKLLRKANRGVVATPPPDVALDAPSMNEASVKESSVTEEVAT